jgi:hypothetical protein
MKSFKQFIKEAMPGQTPELFQTPGYWQPLPKPRPGVLGKPGPPLGPLTPDIPGNFYNGPWTDPETGQLWMYDENGNIIIVVEQPPGSGNYVPVQDDKPKEPVTLPDEDPEEQPTITPDTDPDTEPDGGPDQLEEPSKLDDLINNPDAWPDGVWPGDYNGDGVIDLQDWLLVWSDPDYYRYIGIPAGKPGGPAGPPVPDWAGG